MVIVMRKDLKMRTGKMIAQGAHATIGAIQDLPRVLRSLPPFKDWTEGMNKKICVYVESEEQLINLFNKAKELALPCYLVTDAGLTEFNGVPTKTCIAIGPHWSDEIDKVTAGLPLL